MDQSCFPKTIAYGRREMKAYLQTRGSHCIVAEISGAQTHEGSAETIAGFILTERDAEFAHIITLDVLETFRRKSLGSLLLQAAEQEATSHGAGSMYLETAMTNKAAIALWKKHGYVETGVIVNYYGRGQHAFEMRKRLDRKS
ncbi:MAG TPA: N-acetyltransferase [Candidatus Acidoferrales bacterium]|jgi:ribosomal-protein-alanine N-acetyltransferase|nr:N-acetyltransferase [Candidatus Acidoferrales bacterium]